MSTRIYLVTDTETGTKRLIRSASQAQAVRHAARSKFDVAVASKDTLVLLLEAGTKVEDAGHDEQAPSLADQVIDHVASLLEKQEVAS